MFKVYVNNLQNEIPISTQEIEKITEMIFDAGNLEKIGEISITLVNDEEIAKLNKEYRHREGPTDVLAFAQDEGMEFPEIKDPNFTPLIGDVIISVPTAKRQAEEMGHSLDKELKILLIHGILHLFGYDHDNMYQKKFMEEEEKSILNALEKMTEKASV